MSLNLKVSLCERIKALLSKFPVKTFSQNSLIPIQNFNVFFIFQKTTWESQIRILGKKLNPEISINPKAALNSVPVHMLQCFNV
jgi:hypothetical protein